MLSLDNAMAAGEVREFMRRIRRFLNLGQEVPLPWLPSPRSTGCRPACVTRTAFRAGCHTGDGTVGEDVTANLRTIRDIPQRMGGAGCRRSRRYAARRTWSARSSWR